MSELIMIGMLENNGTTQEHNNRVYDSEGIAPTLTAVSGGTHHIKIFDRTKYRVRKLTPTEYGRLQAFPMDTWEQVVSDSQAYKQFGNAVTVNVVRAIGRNLRACLENYKEFHSPQAQSLSAASQRVSEAKETEDLQLDISRGSTEPEQESQIQRPENLP